MKTVAVYHRSVPNNKNLEKVEILQNFSAWVKRTGDTVIDVADYNIVPSDVGIIQGWVAGESARPHQRLRQQVVTRLSALCVVSINIIMITNKNTYLAWVCFLKVLQSLPCVN